MHNRLEIRDTLKRKLLAGVNIHMPAPRRIGKTWTMNRLASDLTDEGWNAIVIDVQGMRTPTEFARELCRRIETHISMKEKFKTHLAQRLSNILGGNWGDKPLEALGKIDPIEFLDSLICSLDETSAKSAILVDEVAYFFLKCAEDDSEKAKDFAYKLRALTLRYKNVRWLLTGSIGLNIIAKQYGLEGAFVDYETLILEPFTPDQARSYLRDPAVQQQLNHMFDTEDDVFNDMFAELGWLTPFYLKLVANEVRPSTPKTKSCPAKATRPDFEAAFETLLQPNRNSEFAVWREHVEKNFPKPDSEIAMKLLHRLSEDQNGDTLDTLIAFLEPVDAATTKNQVRYVLSMLMNDGIISYISGRYKFRSGLIRRYWKEYEVT